MSFVPQDLSKHSTFLPANGVWSLITSYGMLWLAVTAFVLKMSDLLTSLASLQRHLKYTQVRAAVGMSAKAENVNDYFVS